MGVPEVELEQLLKGMALYGLNVHKVQHRPMPCSRHLSQLTKCTQALGSWSANCQCCQHSQSWCSVLEPARQLTNTSTQRCCKQLIELACSHLRAAVAAAFQQSQSASFQWPLLLLLLLARRSFMMMTKS